MAPAIFPYGLHARISILMVGLLLAAFVSVLIVVDRADQLVAGSEVGRGLQTGQRVFLELLERNRRQLEQAASVLSTDFGFREAVTSNDLRTVRSVLQNHGARIRADVMMLASLEGQLLADTQRPGTGPRQFPFPGLIEEAEKDNRASGIVAMQDGRLYQLVVVPVQAPATVAWVAMGFVIDDTIANELRMLTGLEVSFLRSGSETQWQLLASSLTGRPRDELSHALSGELPSWQAVRTLSLEGERYAVQLIVLPTQSNYRVVAVLQRSLGEALEPFRRQQETLRWVIAIATLLAALAGVLLARNITRPINQLARIAIRIRDGDYSEAATTTARGEIGALADSINLMRDGIAAREKEILRLAYQDALTGLPNRVRFNDRLDHTIRICKRARRSFSILMMDLDRFKYVNDTLGHQVGDLVLAEVGRRLSAILRESDTVARLGGDEFAVLLQDAEAEQVKTVVQKIQRALEMPIVHEGNTLDVGTSIGIASYPEHGDDSGVLLRRADMAMYAAKRSRSGQAVYDPSYEEFRQDHLSLLTDLRRAICDGELQLYYQPKVDLKLGRATGVEALLRWVHPTRGVVSPADFVPFAEQTGFIKELTRWAIARALDDSRKWAVDGIEVRVSINVSARDLNREFPEMLAQQLRSLDVLPRSICLEITESALMESPDRAREILSQLQRLGVGLSIDDYGTGYASLAYLKNFPVQEIKIDRVFIRTMATDRTDSAIVRSTLQLAHDLGLVVVAEGVEERRDLELLAEYGCDYVQGYHISRPMPAVEFVRWWAQSPWGAVAARPAVPLAFPARPAADSEAPLALT